MGKLFVLCFAFLFFLVNIPASAATVVLDPGHGGRDGGTVSLHGHLEKDLNLQLAKLLEAELSGRGHNVRMTRTCDDDTDGQEGFYKRRDLDGRLATAEGADLFVSLHMNASASPGDKGFQVFYADNPQAKIAAANIWHSVQEAGIALRMRQLRPVPERLYLFKHITVPAVLVECGFLSNAEDEALLADADYLAKMAEALAEGIA